MARLLRTQRRGTRNAAAAGPETRFIERLALAQHVIDRAPQPRRQDRQRLALATLRRLLLFPFLGPRATAQKEARRFGKGPAQMRVADLLAAPAQLLVRRRVRATSRA
jgi:hypothetical protein